jgi:hypothetical protein
MFVYPTHKEPMQQSVLLAHKSPGSEHVGQAAQPGELIAVLHPHSQISAMVRSPQESTSYKIDSEQSIPIGSQFSPPHPVVVASRRATEITYMANRLKIDLFMAFLLSGIELALLVCKRSAKGADLCNRL